MNSKLLPVVLLALGVSATATAQSGSKTEKKEKESITIQRDKDSKEKTTIVIDGDNITVNGKPLNEWKDDDVKVFRGRSIAPLTRFRSFGPEGGAKMFGEDFPFGNAGNKAVLGVMSKKDDKGALVTSVEEGSAAEKAGLRKDDIITRVGSTKIAGSEELYDAIGDYKPEDQVTITYLRDGKEAQATATLGKRKNAEVRSFNLNGDDFKRNFDSDFNFRMPGLDKLQGLEGWEMSPFSMNRKPRLGLEIQDVADGKGVKVLEVDEESAAEKAGLKKDDIITDIDGKAVNSVDELRSKTKELKEGESIKVGYLRAGKQQTATLSFAKKLKTAEL